MDHCNSCGGALSYVDRCFNPKCSLFNVYQGTNCENSQPTVVITKFESQVVQKLDTIIALLQQRKDT